MSKGRVSNASSPQQQLTNHRRHRERERERVMASERERERERVMAGLQRSEVSFRRQGSSGLVWDDRFLSGELRRRDELDQDQEKAAPGDDPSGTKPSSTPARDATPPFIETLSRSRSGNGAGGRGYRTGRVSPAIEPPSPKVSACGFCGAFGKQPKNRKTKPGKRRSR